MQMYHFPWGIFRGSASTTDHTIYTMMGSFWESCFLLIAFYFTVTLSSESPQVPIPYLPVTYDTLPESSDHNLHHEISSAQGGYVKKFDNGPQGYKVESGFEGYLVPHDLYKLHKLQQLSEVKEGVLAHIIKFVAPILEHGISVLPKVGLILFSLIALIAVGTIITTSLCAFTPYCHMQFLGVNLTRENFRGFVTQDRITEIAHFLQSAVKKYQNLNRKHVEPAINNNEVK